MLILTRRAGESIRVGGSIKITVFEVKGTQVKIGVEAPEDVSIHREELFRLIQEQNVQAAAAHPLQGEQLTRIWDSLQGKEKRSNSDVE